MARRKGANEVKSAKGVPMVSNGCDDVGKEGLTVDGIAIEKKAGVGG